MAGYTRQSVADIIANAVIKAAPVNAEFNAIRDAFNNSTGHKHDGTSTEGTYVPLIADLDGNNKVVVDTVNNRIGIFSEVGGAAVEQVRIQDGAIVPVSDDDVDLGATGAEFKDLYIDGIGYIDAVVISGNTTVGGILGVTGASGFTGLVTVADLIATGTSTFATVDINGGTIDATVIGASTAAAGRFTTVTTTGQASLATVDINGGTIDGAVIGATTPASVVGTTITANSGFTGDVLGNLTGNVLGNLTGNVTGDVLGNVTGNITASSGASSFNNLTVNGTLDVTGTTIANVTDPVNAQDAATKAYVDTSVANVIDTAPAALDTLNELAAALGDDANFSTTITNSIATKLPLAGGTMTGAIAMGTSKITGLGDPTANQDSATKAYVDQRDVLQLTKTGDNMSGTLSMTANKITDLATPTAGTDATNKTYVDGILGSATAASSSASDAAVSASDAATSATNASTSETNAATSASNAATTYDAFDDRYLGSKSSSPSLDNDGNALLTGALYWDSTSNQLYVWGGSSWQQAAFTLGSALANVVEDTTPQLGGNLTLNNNDITGTGDINITGDIDLTGTLTLSADPTSSLQAATKEYVDTIAAAGLHYHDPVRVEKEGNLNVTYNNGTNGVGATITNSGTQASLVIDGVTMVVADRVLVYEQSDATQNGIYTVTNIGSSSTNWVLTRSTDTDSYSPSDPNSFGQGDAFFVLEGTAGAGELYVMNTAGSITYGTTNITFTQVASTAVYTAGTNLALTGTVFSVSATELNDIANTTATLGNAIVGDGTNYVSTSGSTDAVLLPSGNTAQRPTASNGMIRYNSEDAQFEGYADGAWGAIAGGGGGDTQTATLTSTSATSISTYAVATSLGIEITVIATDTVATERTITKLLVTHDGTTAVATQYGEVNTDTALASYDVDISAGNVRLIATPASTNSTNFTASAVILA